MAARQTPSPNPAQDAVLVTPADADLATPCNALYIGTGGNVRVTTLAGTDVLFTGVPSGSVLPVGAARVWATNTTASAIVALY